MGILFVACVWDPGEQFVEVQSAAVRPTDGGSPDPLLGRGSRWWADPQGLRPSVSLDAGSLVRLRGGEFFYLPPPAFFEEVGN